MKPRITYVHARDDAVNGAVAAKAVAEACSCTTDALVVIDNCNTAKAFIDYLESVSLSDENGNPYPPLVVFLHVSPFVENGDLLSSAVTRKLGLGAERVFIVLVSNADGGVALQSVGLAGLPELAKKRGLGAMTYWPYKISGKREELREAIVRIRACFAGTGGCLPGFDDFRRAVLPEDVIVRDLCGALSRAIHGLENLAVPLRRDAAYLSETVKPESIVDKGMADQYFGTNGYLAGGHVSDSLVTKAARCLQELTRHDDQRLRDALANLSQEGTIDQEKVGNVVFANEDMQRHGKAPTINAGQTVALLNAVAEKIRTLAETLREVRKGMERLDE